ncbi:hypothetical protein HK105_205534 [Polyrhizophydium stewartii]|uniref:Uncharacterized protein n=1 Tax=Polyrhizophydium stewartii TaxID=2732419 RepID=A0ABR4N6A6_9FUNG
MTTWLLRQPAIVVDHRAIGVAVVNFSFESVDALIAHDPLVAETAVDVAVQVDAATFEKIKENSLGVSFTELLDWLYPRHPSGFTPLALRTALSFALRDEMHEVVAFLLKNVTAVDWDLVEARQMVEESNASRKFKKKLRLLIDKYNQRDTTASGEAGVAGQVLHALVLSLSHGLESLRRQLHEQHAAGEALRADLAARTDANTALLGDADALRSMLADLEAEAQAQREAIARMHAAVESHDAACAELQARIPSIEAQLQALRDSLASVSLAAQPATAPPVAEPHVAEPLAAPSRPAIVMPPMRLNADAANLWDRLPDDVRSKIIDLAGDLTKLANGLLHPLEIKMMHESRRVAIWIDAMECDWQGDLCLLPKVPDGQFEYAIRTRSMLVRLLELESGINQNLVTAAFTNHWEDALTPDQLGRPELTAAISGRMDILRNLVETGKVILFNANCILNALVSGHLEIFNWIVKHTRHKAPKFEILAVLLDPSIHELLKDPPRSFFGNFIRRRALVCPESDLGNRQQPIFCSEDHVALEILFRRFGSKIDFSEFEIPLGTVEMLEWAHSRGLTRDKDKVAESIALYAETSKVAQWACERIGVVFEQEHLVLACSKDNREMTAWLLKQPAIVINDLAIFSAVESFSFESVDALIAHDPLVAEKVVVAAVQVNAVDLERIKKDGFDVSLTELLGWLYLRHPSGFTPSVLPPAIGVALRDEMHEVVAFLLKNVTTVVWDLVAARQTSEASNASRKLKKKLRLLIDKFNQLDINGNTCPPLVRFSQACPVLCVSDLTKCPAGATPPACPTGQFYCADGQCRTGASSDAACANVPSLCGCQGGKFANSVSPEQQAATGLLPCMTAAAAKRVNVNVTAGSTIGTDAGDTDLTVACAAAYGISGQITNAATGPFFVQCVRVFKALSSFEPEFMVFYGFVVVQSIILVLYQAYRGIRMSMSRGFAADAAKQTTMFDDGHVELQEVTVRSAKTAPEIKFTGYRRDPLGMLVLGTIVLSSFIWLFLMAIIIADYYEVFSGYSSRNSTLLFGDHENLSRIFIVLWHIMTVWFVALQINSSWLQTYFSVRAPLASASQVLVEKEIATAVQFQNQGKMIEQVQRIEAVLRRLTKTDRSLKLTTVKHTHSGRHYIEFECVRYVFEPTTGSFEPFHFPIGPTNAALLNQAGGLSSSEAERRIELAGANEIIFRVDTFARGIIKEFTGMFYIYQLMTLLIW